MSLNDDDDDDGGGKGDDENNDNEVVPSCCYFIQCLLIRIWCVCQNAVFTNCFVGFRGRE